MEESIFEKSIYPWGMQDCNRKDGRGLKRDPCGTVGDDRY